MQVVECIEITLDGEQITVERLSDGTFLKPAYLAGAERAVVGRGKKNGGASNGRNSPSVGYVCTTNEYDITAPATDLARQWAGWGTALKPAAEEWILARKPLATGPRRITLTAEVLDAWEVRRCAHG